MKLRRKKKRNSTRSLMGLEGFTDYGIRTVGGELAAFLVQPTNISVLSHANVEQKENRLCTLLSLLLPGMEFGRPFDCPLFPGHPELLSGLLLEDGTSGLLKLYGSITGGLVEYSKIVFTKEQYDRHYGIGSPLVEELKFCFKNRMMLFLGCSLKDDRTMELLQEIIKAGAGGNR